MDIYEVVRNKIIIVTEVLSVEYGWGDINIDAIVAEVPGDATHGEVATNVAMVLARPAKKSPRDIANLIVAELKKDDFFCQIEIAGPGFINLTLKPEHWYSELSSILREGDNYARSNIGQGKKINMEFASPNPTGPMHIGHARGAIYGDVLASLLQYTGYQVVREYYVNDAGVQMDNVVRSCYLRYSELCGKKIGEFPKSCYPGEYVVDAAKVLRNNHGDTLLELEEDKWQPIIREFALAYMMDLIKSDLLSLGIKHDVFFYETTLHKENKIAAVVQYMEDKNLVYKGVLEAPKGKTTSDWDSREQLLFKSTDFGDDVDRPLQKSDGSWTYFAADIAYLQNKLQRKFDDLMLILGADHIGYQNRLYAACKALNNNELILHIKLCQMVIYLKNGEPLKMSKRAGNFETVKQVVEVVGRDIIRFIMLTIKNDSILEFDLAKVQELSKDNPVFYVQYAHARAHSVLENAESILPNFAIEKSNIDLTLLNSDVELDLIRTLSYWPKQVKLAALHQEPHRITLYLIHLATKFHSLWSKGKDQKSLRFIISDDLELTKARLTLLQAMITIIASGLGLIGVAPIKKM